MTDTQAHTVDLSHPRGLVEDFGLERANIQAIGFFHQPNSWKEIEAWLSNLSGSERAVATTAAMMAWNLAAKIDGHNQSLENIKGAS